MSFAPMLMPHSYIAVYFKLNFHTGPMYTTLFWLQQIVTEGNDDETVSNMASGETYTLIYQPIQIDREHTYNKPSSHDTEMSGT